MENIAGVRIPDSRLARDAQALARESGPLFLMRHCQRTYVLGVLAARAAGLPVREEIAYIAAVLHDLGLTEGFSGGHRFEVAGAEAAARWARANGLSGEDIQVVWDAIALHTLDGIATARTPEGALVHWGAKTDVLGLVPGQLDPAVERALHNSLPRDDFRERFDPLIQAAAARTRPEPAPALQ